MAVDLNVGSRLPAYCTSLGRVLLAGLPPEELKQYLARVQPVRHTPRTVTSREHLRSIIERLLQHIPPSLTAEAAHGWPIAEEGVSAIADFLHFRHEALTALQPDS